MTIDKMLTYVKGARAQRQVKITTGGEDTLILDFAELDSHRFVTKYYLLLETGELTSVKINRVIRAWLERDTGLFNHPDITMVDNE